MAEENTSTPNPADADAGKTPNGEAPEASAGDTDKDAAYWKARARQWEDKAKRNADAAKAWDDYQESRKTEEQKAADEKAALEADRDAARRDARLATAALKHGLTADDLALIDPTGTDEEFEARAAALAERLASAAAPSRRRDPNLGREHVNSPAGGDWLRQSLTGA